MENITWDEFEKVEIRVGTIIEVNDFPEAIKPAYQVKIDMGEKIGLKQSSAQITKLYSKNDYIYLGLENSGCYITTQNEIINYVPDETIFPIEESETFYAIADGFTVYNIQHDNDRLLLSCGSDGVLIYEWDDQSNIPPSLIAHVTSSYAYRAKIYNGSHLMISTKNGIEVYHIGG